MRKPFLDPRQRSFDGFAEPVATDRLLLLLYVEPAAAGHIAEWAASFRREHGLQGTLVAEDLLHITLFKLGEYAGLPPGRAQEITEQLKAFTAPSFEVGLDHALSFHRKGHETQPFVLCGGEGTEAVRQLQRQLGRALPKEKLSTPRSYQPHVTVMYEPADQGEHAIAPVVWRASEFQLVHSLLGQTRHDCLARWPLHG